MIKKYNQFIGKKTNEEFVFDKAPIGGPETAPATPDVKPDTTEKPAIEPDAPSPIRRERTSPVPAPAKAEMEE